jgi:ankyrin repeat protein
MSKTRTTCALLLSAALASGAVAQEAPPGALPSELPLHTAIAAGDLDAVRHLLELGADPNALISTAGADIKTPLSVAFRDWPWAKDGFGEAVRLLLEAGADPNTGWCSQNRAYTALGWAEGTERTESLALLRAAGAHRTSLDLAMARNATEAALHAAVFEQDIPRVKRLLQAGSDPNAVVVGLEFANGDVDRLRPLRLALAVPEESVPFEEFWANRIEGVRLLLAAGADPNEPFASMCVPGRPTPLLKAIRGYEEEVAMLLLKAGADPNLEAEAYGLSRVQPLTLAAAGGNTAIVQALLDAGAEPTAVALADGVRFNALDVALLEGSTEIADILRARGAVASEPAAAEAAPDDELPRDFAAAYAACTAGSRFDSSIPALGASVRYEIVGPEDDDCRLSMTYLSNPNPGWEGKPLLLTLDPRQRFMAEIDAGMRSCMSGEASRFNCAGPLREVLRRN